MTLTKSPTDPGSGSITFSPGPVVTLVIPVLGDERWSSLRLFYILALDAVGEAPVLPTPCLTLVVFPFLSLVWVDVLPKRSLPLTLLFPLYRSLAPSPVETTLDLLIQVKFQYPSGTKMLHLSVSVLALVLPLCLTYLLTYHVSPFSSGLSVLPPLGRRSGTEVVDDSIGT